MVKQGIFSFLLLFALFGCSIERHAIESPGKNQVIRVQSGDRFFMDLEENGAAGYQWLGTSNDPDVDVIIDHQPGTAAVTIRIHRGYDGPSTVTFVYKRPFEKKPLKKFTITLFRRTGDVAFWE